MAKVDLYVWLVKPDTSAITALNTLKKMGFEVESLKRKLYYSFEVDEAKDFSEKIQKVDILVNANKNKSEILIDSVHKSDDNCVLVQDLDKPTGLLETLKHRLGFSDIKSMEKGTLWEIGVKDKETAEKIAKELLCNKHYQKYEVLEVE